MPSVQLHRHDYYHTLLPVNDQDGKTEFVLLLVNRPAEVKPLIEGVCGLATNLGSLSGFVAFG